MALMRRPILMAARSERVKHFVETMPVSAGIVRSYVAGERTQDAVDAAEDLVVAGLNVTADYLGEDTLELAQAQATVAAYLDLLGEFRQRGIASGAEVSVKLSAVGQYLPDTGAQVALEHARTIARTAANSGTTVTLDAEDHTTTDATLATLRELRQDFPETGAVVQAYLRRTEADCRRLAFEGSRVRLCKGAYAEPEDVAFTDPHEVDLSYVRCLRILLEGDGYPMIATHDPRMIEIALWMIEEIGREPGTYEFQMLYGIRTTEQKRLAELGHTVRVYLPYGQEWYGYLMRRLAERPRNLTFFMRSLVSKK
jgi:proline dehydrogenase